MHRSPQPFPVRARSWLAFVSMWIATVPALATGLVTGNSPIFAAPPRGIQAASVDRPIEESVQQRAVGGARSLLRLERRASHSIEFALRKWWIWLRRAMVFFVIGIAASLLDRRLWSQWRTQPLKVLTVYVPLAAMVYLRVLFDRHADRLGQLVLVAALVYAVVPGDFVPDSLFVVGAFDDTVVVAAAARWFMWRCPPALIERHARFVERWRERTAQIQAHRRAVRRSREPDDINALGG